MHRMSGLIPNPHFTNIFVLDYLKTNIFVSPVKLLLPKEFYIEEGKSRNISKSIITQLPVHYGVRK